MPKMTEEDLHAIVRAEIEDACDYIDESISPVRARAANFYMGRPFGNEEEGRSQVVSNDVRDTVNALLPSLMKIFTSSERVVEFAPTHAEDVKLAEQATDYCNFVYMKDNDGYLNLYHTFKDAMVRKTGIQKIWWEEKEEVDIKEYEGLDESTIAILLSEPEAEVSDIEVEYRTESVQQQDPQTGEVFESQVQVPYYDCKVKKTTKEGRICVDVVPPEEFIIARNARSMETASFVGQRALKTVSELIEMGVDADLLEDRVTSEEFWENEESTERSEFTEKDHSFVINKAMRKVLYVEAYVLIDFDGDGIAERRKICTIGEDHYIVENNPDSLLPFADFTVDSEPHLSCVEATSVADKLMDIQLIKSNVLRTGLDSMAQTITPRTVILNGNVNAADVLNNKIGAVIREDVAGAVRELVTTPIFQQAFGMLEYLDTIKESRTGVSRAAAGLDPDALRNTTANAANFQVSATQSQMELVARNLANGFKKVFRIMLQIMVLNQDKKRIIRLRNEWVPIDPKLWNPKMDVEINVALGRGTDSERLNILSGIAAKQEQVMGTLGPENPLVNLAQYSNTLTKIVELSGHKNTSAFVTDLPDDFKLPPAPPQVDPSTQTAELLAQVEREKTEAKREVDQANFQLKQQELIAKIREKEIELELKAQKLENDRLALALKEREAEANIAIREAEMVLKQLTQIRGNQQHEEDATKAHEGQEADAQKEGMLSQAIVALGQLIAQGQTQTAQALNAPKRVVRDQTGRVTGVETGESSVD